MVKKILKKRVSSQALEALILALMLVFGIIAVYIFIDAMQQPSVSTVILLVEVMILQILAILGLTFAVLKVYEKVSEK